MQALTVSQLLGALLAHQVDPSNSHGPLCVLGEGDPELIHLEGARHCQPSGRGLLQPWVLSLCIEEGYENMETSSFWALACSNTLFKLVPDSLMMKWRNGSGESAHDTLIDSNFIITCV